jgi:hypothetical protein
MRPIRFRLMALVRAQWAGLLALFLVIAGGTAYATHPGGANTISSIDIINGEVKGLDIGPEAVGTTRLKADGVTSEKVLDNTLTGSDINPGAFFSPDITRTGTQFEIAPGAIQRSEMGSNAVASDQIPALLERPGTPVTIDGGESANGDWGSGQAGASCNAGEDLLFGLGEWLENSSGEELAIVEVRVDYSTDDVAAVGISDSGAEEFRAVAICMPAS